MKFHIAAAIAVLTLGMIVRLPRGDALWLVLAITLVLMAELINTAIEKAVDLAMPDHHPDAKSAKDAAAAAVLAAAVFAVCTAVYVFSGPIYRMIVSDRSADEAPLPIITDIIVLLIPLILLAAVAMAAAIRRKRGPAYMQERVSDQRLLDMAAQARTRAYAPYSKFTVGSALLGEDGTIHLGCNVENAAYGPSNCAERTALFRAIADGNRPGSFAAIAVIGDTEQPIAPCGVCRQVLIELCAPDMRVIMGNLTGQIIVKKVSELLPGAFHKEVLR